MKNTTIPKELTAEINRMQNKIKELEAKLNTATENLNFYKDQNAKHQQIIGQLQARLHVFRDSMPVLEAPAVDLPHLTKEDY